MRNDSEGKEKIIGKITFVLLNLYGCPFHNQVTVGGVQ